MISFDPQIIDSVPLVVAGFRACAQRSDATVRSRVDLEIFCLLCAIGGRRK